MASQVDSLWDMPLRNGQDCFFTEESFSKHSALFNFQDCLKYKVKELDNLRNRTSNTNDNGGTSKTANSETVDSTTKKKGQPSRFLATVSESETKKKFPYPRQSSLTKSEQKEYLGLYSKFLNYVPQKPSQSDICEIEKFKELQLKVGKEQEEFLLYLENLAKSKPEDYKYLHPQANKYVEEKQLDRRQKVKCYPQYYSFLDSIALSGAILKKDIPVMKIEKLLLQMGTLPKVTLPDMKMSNKPIVPVDYEKVNKRFPVTEKYGSNQENPHFKEVTSNDENVFKLALKNNFQIVLCSAVFECLVNNLEPKYEHEWEIPICVKEIEETSAHGLLNGNAVSGQRKIVIMDNPLPARLSGRHKNAFFHKYALKTLITHKQASHNTLLQTRARHVPGHMDATETKNAAVEKFASAKGDKSDHLTVQAMSSDISSAEVAGLDNGKQVEIDGEVYGVKKGCGRTQKGKRNATPKNSKNLIKFAKTCSKLTKTPSQGNKQQTVTQQLHIKSTKTPTVCESANLSEEKISKNSESANIGRISVKRQTRSEKKCSDVNDDDTESPPKKRNLSGAQLQPSPRRLTRSQQKLDDMEPSVAATENQAVTKNNVSSFLPATSFKDDASVTSINLCNIKPGNTNAITQKRGRPRRNVADQSQCDNQESTTINTAQESLSTRNTKERREHDVFSEKADFQGDDASARKMQEKSIEQCKKRGRPKKMLFNSDNLKTELPKGQNVVTEKNINSKNYNNAIHQKMVQDNKENGAISRTENIIENSGTDVKDVVDSKLALSALNNESILSPSENDSRESDMDSDVIPVREIPFHAVSLESSSGSDSEMGDALQMSCEIDTVTASDNQGLERKMKNKKHFDNLAEESSKTSVLSNEKSNKCDGESVKSSTISLDDMLKAQSEMLHLGKPVVSNHSGLARTQVKQEKEYCENPSDYKVDDQENMTYCLWSFGHINILSKSSFDGVLREVHSTKAKNVVIVPKMEYQPQFGMEQVLPSETATLWASSFLRNNCNVIRARINAFTSEIMMLEDLSPSQILYPRCPFNPATAMNQVHSILNRVSKLDVGHYLLYHAAGEPHCHIKKETGKRVNYDLHLKYSVKMEEHHKQTKVTDWIPIDPNILLPKHKKDFRIPATFDPKTCAGDKQTKNKKKQKKKKARVS